MKRIEPIHIDNKKLFQQVIRYKHEPTKTRLNDIIPNIFSAYDSYDTNRFELEKLEPDPQVVDRKDELHKCYKVGKRIAEIKKMIKENVPDGIKGKCLFCMISEPNGFDHYLDKEEFPEFSIYTDNLIPCCSYCNSKKGKAWKDNQGRITLNAYFDDIINGDYLFIDIEMSKKNPMVKDVRLNFESLIGVTAEQIELVKKHYDKLDLCNRYKDQATRLLCNIVDEFLYSTRSISEGECEALLYNKAESLERINGKNHWETAVYRGILANDSVIRWIVSN